MAGDEDPNPLIPRHLFPHPRQTQTQSKRAIGDGISWKTPCKRGEAEAQLGDSEIKAMSLGGSVVARIHR